ncbi:MAG TPA: hypothetical protein VHB23_02270 [Devosiaceae bacterium]|jgi:hypothetical protein|nr:hypothetical protein [Devosiaceae bacterium]
MRRREGILGALGAIAAGLTGGKVTASNAAFISLDTARRCNEITAIDTFEDFWINPDAMSAYNHKDDPCHEVAIQHYLTLHYKPSKYSF